MVVIKFCCLKALRFAVLYATPAPEVGTQNRSPSESSIHRMSPTVAQELQGKQRGMGQQVLRGLELVRTGARLCNLSDWPKILNVENSL